MWKDLLWTRAEAESSTDPSEAAEPGLCTRSAALKSKDKCNRLYSYQVGEKTQRFQSLVIENKNLKRNRAVGKFNSVDTVAASTVLIIFCVVVPESKLPPSVC